MSSNKSTPRALVPSRKHGKERVEAIFAAARDTFAEKGFDGATMAEVAARAGAPIGSLYRFFPTKEVLAEAFLLRHLGRVEAAFGAIQARVPTAPLAELADALLGLLVSLREDVAAAAALLDTHDGWSARRGEFRSAVQQHLAATLQRRCPRLPDAEAQEVASVLLPTMKLAAKIAREPGYASLPELRAMVLAYLAARLDGP